jgi:UDP-N-acetylglucosamine acyltransferase
MSNSKNHPSKIHPTAVIEPGAQIGERVTIEAYAIVKSNVVLEDDVTIRSHVYLDGHLRVGAGTTIWPFASVGTKCQDLKYQGDVTHVRIGRECEIRECVTINSSTKAGTSVTIGDNCLIMAYCHIAHDCKLGNRVIMSNNATLAGHIEIEDFAIIGGLTAVHQRVRVGCHAMVGGVSRVTHDVPPYTIGGGIPYKLGGLNLIGLKRRQFPQETRRWLSKAFKLVYRSGLHLDEALRAIEAETPSLDELHHWIQFCKGSERGLIGLQGVARDESYALMDEESDNLEE